LSNTNPIEHRGRTQVPKKDSSSCSTGDKSWMRKGPDSDYDKGIYPWSFVIQWGWKDTYWGKITVSRVHYSDSITKLKIHVKIIFKKTRKQLYPFSKRNSLLFMHSTQWVYTTLNVDRLCNLRYYLFHHKSSKLMIYWIAYLWF
jgi:hypothetical protein